MIWQCEKPILKKVWFDKDFTSFPHFIVYDFEATLVPLNELPIGNLTYLSRDTPVNIDIHDTLGREPVYSVDENLERVLERFIKVLTGKQEIIIADALKLQQYPSNFQIFQVR